MPGQSTSPGIFMCSHFVPPASPNSGAGNSLEGIASSDTSCWLSISTTFRSASTRTLVCVASGPANAATARCRSSRAEPICAAGIPGGIDSGARSLTSSIRRMKFSTRAPSVVMTYTSIPVTSPPGGMGNETSCSSRGVSFQPLATTFFRSVAITFT